VNLPQVNVVDLPAPPPEFHMETWLTTINRLEAAELTTLYPTHFGPIDDVHGHLVALRGLLIDAVAFVAERLAAGVERDALLDEYVAWNRSGRASHVSRRPSIGMRRPTRCYVGGRILRYLRKRAAVGERPGGTPGQRPQWPRCRYRHSPGRCLVGCRGCATSLPTLMAAVFVSCRMPRAAWFLRSRIGATNMKRANDATSFK
jgi:hypothetical protein